MKFVFVLSGTGAFHLKQAFEREGGRMGLLSFYDVRDLPLEKMEAYLMHGIDALRKLSNDRPRMLKGLRDDTERRDDT